MIARQPRPRAARCGTGARRRFIPSPPMPVRHLRSEPFTIAAAWPAASFRAPGGIA